MKIEEIKELIRAMDESSLGTLEYTEGGVSLSIRRGGAEQVSGKVLSIPESAGTTGVKRAEMQAEPSEKPYAEGEKTASKASDKTPEPDRVITSPLVGTFYAAASPEDEPYVKAGDTIKKGQVLGIIEAMKLMNEVESDMDGRIEAILVENGQMVEFGQPLFRIS